MLYGAARALTFGNSAALALQGVPRGFLGDIRYVPALGSEPNFRLSRPAYKGRNEIERAFSHLKDWRRVATRYDKLARNFRATVTLAIIFKWWI
jgi:putative transposase